LNYNVFKMSQFRFNSHILTEEPLANFIRLRRKYRESTETVLKRKQMRKSNSVLVAGKFVGKSNIRSDSGSSNNITKRMCSAVC